jgi:glycosyltransferase involved in cell wall biosynthesis
MKKRILSVCDINPIRFGSFEEFMLELTKIQSENKFEHVIVFRDKPMKNVENALLNAGAKIEIIKPSKYNTINFFKFHKLIKDVQPQIVHFHFYPPYSFINYLHLLTSVKIIYTDHMGIKKVKPFFRKFLRKLYYYTHFKFFDCGVDKIVCVSNFVKLKYTNDYGVHSNKLCVIYNGININRFHKKIDTLPIKNEYNLKDELIITCVAGLRKDKGVQCLIRAATIITKEIPHIKFFIVGDGRYRSHLENLVDKFRLRDYFIFTGFRSNMEDFYSTSFCVVIPSLVDEAFCFVVAEAVASEVPVIAFNSGALEEVFGKIKTVHIIPKNYELLAENIINLSKTTNSVSLLKDGRDEIVNNFSSEACASKYFTLYKDILKVGRT